MQSNNKISKDILVKSIESLVKDVENPLRKLGISEQIIQYISSLLNKYSLCQLGHPLLMAPLRNWQPPPKPAITFLFHNTNQKHRMQRAPRLIKIGDSLTD